MKRTHLLILFFISGISGLIYQISWVRQASLTFGVSVYAFSTVLTAYMGGLALGSYWLGRRIDHMERPLRTYAWLEIGIAVLAILVSFVLPALNNVYAAVAKNLQPGLGILTMLRLGLSVITLMPSTILIGATLPVMSRIYARRSGRVGSDVGQLFSVNTAGAVVGCLITALFLIRIFGVREAIFIGAALNGLIAIWAFRLDATWRSRPISEAPQKSNVQPRRIQKAQTATEVLSKNALYFIIGGYALSGFAALGYEIIWARILSIHTIHAIYSFAMVLTVFLSGLAIGGILATWWLRKHKATLLEFGIGQLGVGLLSILTLYIFARLPALSIEGLFGGYSVTNEILYELVLALITVFPPTLLLGAMFPLVSSLYTIEQVSQLGLRIGTVSALNTAGSILGAVVTGFILIPLLGLRNTSLTLSAINLLIGMGAIWMLQRSRPQIQWIAPTAIGIAAIAAYLIPPGLYLGFREGPSEHLVFYEEGVETTVAVFDVADQNFKVSFVNGRNEVPTDQVSMQAFRLLGHLPAILKPDAENALVLSFGNGIATGTLDTHAIPAIDAVDLSAEMIKAASIYWEENYNVLRSARLNLHIEDARNFLLQTDSIFDIITTDATHPVNASSWALFTQEFYQLIDQRLSDDGIFVQWLPFHSLLESDYQSIIRTAQSVFPHTTLWYTGGSHTFLVITRTSLTEDMVTTRLNQSADNQIVVDDLGLPNIIRSYWVMNEVALIEYTGSGPLVTDNDAFFFSTNEETLAIMEFMQTKVGSMQ